MTKRLLGSTVTNEIILKCRKECEELKSKVSNLSLRF